MRDHQVAGAQVVVHPAQRVREVLLGDQADPPVAEVDLDTVGEQRRIVAALEDHLSRLDAGLSNLMAANKRRTQLHSRILAELTTPTCTEWRPVRLGDVAHSIRNGMFVSRPGADPDGVAILRIGWLCQAPYEWGEHVLIAKRLGIGSDEIERVTRGSLATEWSEHERAILRAAEELHENAMISAATWEPLSKQLDDRQLIELPILIGQYQAVAYYQNSLRLRLHNGNLGLKAR